MFFQDKVKKTLAFFMGIRYHIDNTKEWNEKEILFYAETHHRYLV